MPSENRRFLRVPVCGNHRTAVVRLEGKKPLTCELINTSSGGYGVAVEPKHSTEFPPGRILLVEVDDVVIRAKVAHVAWDEQQFQVGFERLAELEDAAVASEQQPGRYSTATLVRDLLIAGVLLCTCLAFFFLPTLIERFHGAKKARVSVPAVVAPPATPAASRSSKTQPPKSAAHAVEVDGRLGVLPRN